MFAPIIHRFRELGVPHFVIHTGQHYSPNMDAQLFEDLGLPAVDYRLQGIETKRTHGAQTGAMLEGVERVFLEERPKLVLVGGDANTNLAGALAARKLGIEVGHVEAGERSYDWRMPEEHNRRMIDHISEHLFATGTKARKQLLKESVQGKIYVVGNPIVDASRQHLEIAERKSDVMERFGVKEGAYCILTTHREENVDSLEKLRGSLSGVSRASAVLKVPVVFLAHPRTLKRLKEFNLLDWSQTLPGICLKEGIGYLDFLKLLAHSRLVFTDSGGVQQEAAIHHIPAVTLRENTEWVETLAYGANRLAGTDPDRIVRSAKEAAAVSPHWRTPFGDGDAAKKITDVCTGILEDARQSMVPRAAAHLLRKP
jgi:UDP-N-acetylglucosamine 2-epimerase (non-hydrolysing)